MENQINKKMEIKDLMHTYCLLGLAGAKDTTLRPGFYAIAEIRTITSKYGRDIVMAKGFYSYAPTFEPALAVDFRIDTLKNSASIGPTSIMLEQLLNCVIQVKGISKHSHEYQGKPTTSYKVEWNFVGGVEEVIQYNRLKMQQDLYIQNYINEEALYDEYLSEELEIICLLNGLDMLDGEEDGLLYDNYCFDMEKESEEEGLLFDESETSDNQFNDIADTPDFDDENENM